MATSSRVITLQEIEEVRPDLRITLREQAESLAARRQAQSLAARRQAGSPTAAGRSYRQSIENYWQKVKSTTVSAFGSSSSVQSDRLQEELTEASTESNVDEAKEVNQLQEELTDSSTESNVDEAKEVNQLQEELTEACTKRNLDKAKGVFSKIRKEITKKLDEQEAKAIEEMRHLSEEQQEIVIKFWQEVAKFYKVLWEWVGELFDFFLAKIKEGCTFANDIVKGIFKEVSDQLNTIL